RQRRLGIHDRARDAGHHESLRSHRGAEPGTQDCRSSSGRSGEESRRGRGVPGLPGYRRQAARSAMTTTDVALELSSIESGYGEVQVLWGISLKVRAGQLTTIIGANGAGKTT